MVSCSTSMPSFPQSFFVVVFFFLFLFYFSDFISFLAFVSLALCLSFVVMLVVSHEIPFVVLVYSSILFFILSYPLGFFLLLFCFTPQFVVQCIRFFITSVLFRGMFDCCWCCYCYLFVYCLLSVSKCCRVASVHAIVRVLLKYL